MRLIKFGERKSLWVVMLGLVLFPVGCSAKGNNAEPNAIAPSTPIHASSDATSSSPPADGPEIPELGPTAVRVLSTKLATPGNLELQVIGPDGATYGYQDGAGKVAECRQVDRGEQEVPPPGLPRTSHHRMDVICENAGKIANGSKLLVKVVTKTFTYDFQVPATVTK
jgi:hypothetical protein